MENPIYKTKISISYIGSIILVSMIISFMATYKSKDDILKLAPIIFGYLLLFAFIFNLFFKSSIALTYKFLIINYSPFLFFLKPNKYELNNIQNIDFYYIRGKGVVPRMVINFKNTNKRVTFSFFLISKKSVLKLSECLSKLNINMKIIDDKMLLKNKHVA